MKESPDFIDILDTLPQATHMFCFVGENPSPTAIENDWTWEDGRLAAAQLKNALESLGLNFGDQLFTNLFDENGEIDRESKERVEAAILEGMTIVGMGNKVKKGLRKLEIEHKKIVHPAARGKIRKIELYASSVGQVLMPDNI